MSRGRQRWRIDGLANGVSPSSPGSRLRTKYPRPQCCFCASDAPPCISHFSAPRHFRHRNSVLLPRSFVPSFTSLPPFLTLYRPHPRALPLYQVGDSHRPIPHGARDSSRRESPARVPERRGAHRDERGDFCSPPQRRHRLLVRPSPHSHPWWPADENPSCVPSTSPLFTIADLSPTAHINASTSPPPRFLSPH